MVNDTIGRMSEVYKLAPALPDSFSEQLPEYPAVLKQLLFNRSVTDPDAITRFLEPSFDTHLHDPFLLNDMERAVDRLRTAIAANERILVFSDYDCDGIPGAVIMHDLLHAVGHTEFVTHIPHRHYDGFGLSVSLIERLIDEHAPSLIATIDCGTSDVEAVNKARERGVDVIITDHHEPKDALPTAVAIVNPKVGDTYPFTGLCGAAVVFKLAQALLARGDFPVSPGTEKWWLDMVGIATVADMVPLLDENRVLAQYGLLVLRKSRRPGLQQLLRAQRVDQRRLTEDDIGFVIAPRINAASRMDTPEDAYILLTTTDEAEAAARVRHLEQLNTERKTAVGLITKDIHKRFKLSVAVPDVIVLGNPEWRPSLVGLAANKLAEEHNRPAFLWGRDGNQQFKGSCRSNGSVSVVRIMDATPEVFDEYGGHHFSGGFTVTPSYIHTLSEQLQIAYEALGESAFVKEVHHVDVELTLDEVTKELLATQQRCAPFGADNRKPLYLFKAVSPDGVEVFGKSKNHTKLSFTTRGLAKEAIAFFQLPHQFTREPCVGEQLSLLAHVEESFFMGRTQIRLRIVDIL